MSRESLGKYGLACALFPLVVACTADQTQIVASVQELRAAHDSDNDLLLSLGVLVTDDQGVSIPCTKGELSVSVSVSFQGADHGFIPIPAAQTQVACAAQNSGDFALVADNSGSENGFLPDLKSATHLMIDKILSNGGRASLTRVSTTAQTVHPLSADPVALGQATDAMFVSNGWTALADGIRMGNEALGGARIADTGAPGVFADRASFCNSARKLGIVAFTDGQENNSSGQKMRDDDDDGIDTTVDDLHNLKVDGITTPVYAVGLGRNIDAAMLSGLAEETGGRFLPIDHPSQIPQVFDLISDYSADAFSVCVDMPGGGCGKIWVKTDYEWTDGQQTSSGSRLELKDMPCPVVAAAPGRVATILLTLGDPGIPPTLGAQLVRQAALWVVPKATPRVLVVRDGNNHGEDVTDSEIVRDMLIASGLPADLIEEPTGGLSAQDFAAYDVIWFSNPGYPMDDQSTFNALLSASRSGKGVVLQGDDLTWAWGQSFSMAPLTHLNFKDNGTKGCGVHVDNQAGGKYNVQINGNGHPITAGLDGETFTYGNDIDLSVPRHEGEMVVTAVVSVLDKKGRVACTDTRPVVVGFQP